MKRFLMLLGMTLEIAAFLGAQADRVPLFGNIVAPAYYRAIIGFNQILSREPLRPDAPGFKEVVLLLAQENKDLQNKTILEVKEGQSSGASWMSDGSTISYTSFDVKTQNGSEEYQIRDLREKVRDQFLISSILRWSWIVFTLGLYIHFLGFLMEPSHKSTAPVVVKRKAKKKIKK
ncbi:MAG: hypothetical protein WCS85_04230 [Candidatus Peribacteraceae bacterium]|jgi:hypothetical protein